MVEASPEAIADAGIETADIDAAWFSICLEEQKASASPRFRWRKRSGFLISL